MDDFFEYQGFVSKSWSSLWRIAGFSMSFLGRFIATSYLISCLCTSYVRHFLLCTSCRFVVVGSATNCTDPMPDHWDNMLEEFKV